MRTYYIEEITPDGKNKTVKVREVYCDHFVTSENNNLAFYGTESNPLEFIVMFHSYNWKTVDTRNPLE